MTRNIESGVHSQSDSNKGNQIDFQADTKTVGLTDAVLSGFYLSNSAELVDGLSINPEDLVLDVGCGSGLAAHFCARQGAHVVFCDIEKEKVEALSELLSTTNARKVEGLVSDCLPIPMKDETASVILAMEILEHTDNPSLILNELYRVGKPGARYLITVPDPRAERLQRDTAPTGYFEKPNHIQVFEKEEFQKLVEDAGLRIEKHMTWGFYWTIWWALKWLDHRERLDGEMIKLVDPPYSPMCQAWSNLWYQVQASPNSGALIEALNELLPKSQGVLARKPG